MAGPDGIQPRTTRYRLKLTAGTQLSTVVINKAAWVDRHGQTGGLLMMKRWETTNQLEVRPPLRDLLRRHLMALMHGHSDAEQTEPSEQLMQTLIRCCRDPAAETLPIAKREAWHQVAIDLLHWCDKHPKTPLKIEEISSEIFQSRTSLFQGSKEHFQRTPLELQRSIRLDRVRQLLINPKQRQHQGFNGVSEIVEAMGFSSRSHFARR